MADVIQKIQFKRGKQADLIAVLVGENKLAIGEPAYETDTGKVRIGDGVSNYSELPYIGGETELVFASRYSFPAVGNALKLYIAKDEDNIYRWQWDDVEETSGKYVLVGVDSAANKEIYGGDADDFYDI